MRYMKRPAVLMVAVLLFGCSTAPDHREEREKQCASDAPMGFWYNGALGVVLEDSARTGEPVTAGEMLDWIDRDKVLQGVSLNPVEHTFIDITFATLQSRVEGVDRDAVLTRGQKLAAASAWYDLANSVLDISDLSDWCRAYMKLG